MKRFLMLVGIVVVLVVGCGYLLPQVKQRTVQPSPQSEISFSQENKDSLKAIARQLGRDPSSDASVTGILSEIKIALKDTVYPPKGCVLTPEEVEHVQSSMSLDEERDIVKKIEEMNKFLARLSYKPMIVLPDDK
ncbi:MAG: hypothetical protein Q4D98_07365 [Planctomycetia bacterium]|nr:hypothetical protein [Planctomycetia bacterium]